MNWVERPGDRVRIEEKPCTSLYQIFKTVQQCITKKEKRKETHCTKFSHRTTYSGTFSTASCRKNQYLWPKTGRSLRSSKVILYTELPNAFSSASGGIWSSWSLDYKGLVSKNKKLRRQVLTYNRSSAFGMVPMKTPPGLRYRLTLSNIHLAFWTVSKA